MRDVPLPAYTVSADSANLVLHRFCHSTIFVGPMVRSQDIRKHVLKARGILLSTPITNHLSPLGPTTRHVTRTKIMALWEQGTTQRGIAKTVGCGLATVARWVHKFKDANLCGDSRQHRCARRTSSRSPNKAHQGDWKSNREIH